MLAEPTIELTERQRAVLERIDRRLPLKSVAAELGISESRVNQHVKALKELYGVHSLKGLVEAWRAEREDLPEHYRKPAWRNPQLPGEDESGDEESRVVPGDFVLSDAAPLAIEARWMVESEPRVVPGMLDGDHAALIRLAVIIGLAFGMVAAVVLVVTASLSMSEAMEGAASVPVNDRGSAN
jgi:DNA-binding CsgD family transcriptional regulator